MHSLRRRKCIANVISGIFVAAGKWGLFVMKQARYVAVLACQDENLPIPTGSDYGVCC